MKFGLDDYAHLESPLHQWEPRCKLIGLMGLIFAFAMVRDQRLMLPMLGVSASIYALSQLPVAYWRTRLRYPGLFLVGVVGFLPFISGQRVLFQLGPIALYQEGTLAMAGIASRFLAIITLSLVLFGTASFLTTIRTLRSLGLSPILTDMMILFYRYLFELGDRLHTMQSAMRLRGFKRTRLTPRALQTLASVAGTLLVQSYEQSERIYQAMRLRGYGQKTVLYQTQPWQFKDVMGLGLVLGLAGTFMAAELWLSSGVL
ncbi:cobalt ECF transporter T component CbiQ [Oscillatoria acuminata]|uniref:Cobalt ABC transporter, permease protein CbiQ n=1 Tax=Oscillatoria acuminata PCC 6304 TaxID=56110 RepID=K9TRF9_9CYAN|nr:cobalt ECF transporter T component CbiQ [Oscillatoria acuminata]AFY85145.1 cobalt ABC transporter, permease protein CbiQ [Oscillatoria acuminata PCC 6304]